MDGKAVVQTMPACSSAGATRAHTRTIPGAAHRNNSARVHKPLGEIECRSGPHCVHLCAHCRLRRTRPSTCAPCTSTARHAGFTHDITILPTRSLDVHAIRAAWGVTEQVTALKQLCTLCSEYSTKNKSVKKAHCVGRTFRYHLSSSKDMPTKKRGHNEVSREILLAVCV